MSEEPDISHSLTKAERELIRWMLEHGEPDAAKFLVQLELARVTSWKCPCGCASINLTIDGTTEPKGGMRVLADFLFGGDEDLSGIFVWQENEVLAGLEVYGLAGDAPKTLPDHKSLRPISDATNNHAP